MKTVVLTMVAIVGFIVAIAVSAIPILMAIGPFIVVWRILYGH